MKVGIKIPCISNIKEYEEFIKASIFVASMAEATKGGELECEVEDNSFSFWLTYPPAREEEEKVRRFEAVKKLAIYMINELRLVYRVEFSNELLNTIEEDFKSFSIEE